MWSSSSSAITNRRRLLGLLAAWPLAVFAGTEAPLAGLRRWGSGSYRWFGLRVYDATLWAGNDPTQPPLALRLTYQRDIRGSDIAEASVDEMRKLGNADKAHGAVQPGGSSPKGPDGKLLYEEVWKYLFTHPVDEVGEPAPADPDCRQDHPLGK